MFVVTKRFGRSETRVGDFSKQADALKFIQEKLREDILYKINATYGLYEGADLLQELKQSDVVTTQTDSSTLLSGDSTGAPGSRSSFSPTPFNTAPRPTGMPPNWIKDEDDDKKK
jgi:hypothetical protein